MAVTPEQIKASLTSLTPSEVKKAVPKKVKPLIEPSTTTTTTEIIPEITTVKPMTVKQNQISPSLEVQAGVQPEKDYVALATPQEKRALIDMVRAGGDPVRAKIGLQKTIDRRLTQENNARGQEPKNYVDQNNLPVVQPTLLDKAKSNIITGFPTRAVASGLNAISGAVKGAYEGLAGQGFDEALQKGKEIRNDPNKSTTEKLLEIPVGIIAAKYGLGAIGDFYNGAMEGVYEGSTTTGERKRIIDPAVEKAQRYIADIAGVDDNNFIVKKYNALPESVKKRVDDWTSYALDATNIIGVSSAIQPVKRLVREGLESVATKGVQQGVKTIIPQVNTAKNVVGQIIQGKKKDVVPALRALKEINTQGISTYDDLARTIKTKGQEYMQLLDDRLSTEGVIIKPNNAKITTTLGKTKITQEPVAKGIQQLKEMYTAIDDPVNLARVIELEKKFKKTGLSLKEVNDVAREYNGQFGSKAFTKTGDPLTSVNAQAFENNRKAMKEYVRGQMSDDVARELDIKYSDIARTQELVDKMAEKVNSLSQKIQERGLVENVMRLVGRGLDLATFGGVRGLLTSFLPSNIGNKVLNSLDLQSLLKTNLGKLDDILRNIEKGNINADDMKFLFSNNKNVSDTIIPSTTSVQQPVKIAPVPTAPTNPKITPILNPAPTKTPIIPAKTVTMDTKVVSPKKTVVPKPNNNLVDLQRSALHTEVTKPLSRAEARTGNFETQFGKIEDIVFDRGREKLVIDGKQYLPSEVKIFERKPVADFDNILKEKVPVKTKEEGYISEIAKQEGQKASMLKQVSDDMVDTAKLSPSELSEYNDLLARAIQGRGENGATALEKLYNKYGKDVYGKTKTIVPVTQEVAQSTTAPKKQSVLPKPQEKQAVLEGKKEGKSRADIQKEIDISKEKARVGNNIDIESRMGLRDGDYKIYKKYAEERNNMSDMQRFTIENNGGEIGSSRALKKMKDQIKREMDDKNTPAVYEFRLSDKKSQVPTPKTPVSKELQPLYEEAKRFGSVEEWVDSFNPGNKKVNLKSPINMGDIEGMSDGLKVYKKEGPISFLKDNDGTIYAKVDGKEVGYIGPLMEDSTFLEVVKEYQGKGIGTALVKELGKSNIKQLKKSGGFSEGGRKTYIKALREIREEAQRQ